MSATPLVGYYVTMIRGRRKAWLLGPFDAHADALARVDEARRVAQEIDPWSDFDLFGTAKVRASRLPPGVLNKHLNLASGG